jgi:predicted O-methyltransferase YrrM
MQIYIIITLILLNLIIFYFYKRKKIKNFFLNVFFQSIIKSVELYDVHKIFLPNKNVLKFKFPTEEVVIKSFITDKSFNIAGQTTDYEAWILSCFAKFSKNIFEFGTCSGKTTTLFALNSSQDSKIYTITLRPDEINNISFNTSDTKVAIRNAINESIYNQFIFNNMSIENKINLIFEDSTKFDESKLTNSLDLIFIDGGHNYSCVKNDSEKAFKMIKNGGYIFWHDYVVIKKSCKDVVKYIHEISEYKKIFHIKNTSLCYYKKID